MPEKGQDLIPDAPAVEQHADARASTFKDYADACKRMPLDDFVRAFPNPVLLFSRISTGRLTPVQMTRSPTIDRLVVGDTPRGGVATVSPDEWYMVYEVRPRDAAADRISIGCSSQCDIRLDDASVSRIHAWITQTGGAYLLQDAGSTSGSSHKGKTLDDSEMVSLGSGDKLCLGNVDLIFMAPAQFYVFAKSVG